MTLVYGLGNNDAGYNVVKTETVDGKRRVTWACPYHVAWSNMLTRCYNSNKNLKSYRPSYEGCDVCTEWLTFSKFRAWMREQQWIEFAGSNCDIVKKQLDKDLLSGSKRGKLYSPDTCVFISRSLNMFLTTCERSRGEFPIGVYKRGRKYRAQISGLSRGNNCHLGCYSTPEEAHTAYVTAKKELARQLAAEQTDPRIAHVLLNMDWSNP